MKMTVSLPGPLLKSADRLAKRLRISRSELLQLALTRLLEHDSRSITAALDEIYARDDVPHGVDPVLARLQALSLPQEDW